MNDDEKGYQYDRSEMLMRQRNYAEEERDSWQIRAMKAEVERQALAATNTNLRDLLILAEGQRDQAKMRAEAAEAECKALRTVDDAIVERFLHAYAECENQRPQTFTHRIGIRAALTAALAVQP